MGSDSKSKLIAAARDLVAKRGVTSTTVDKIVESAGCSKGMVSYHFKGKKGLLEAVASEVTTQRIDSWETALNQKSVQTAIDRSWRQLEQEVADGTFAAWRNLQVVSENLTEQTVRKSVTLFADHLGLATERMLVRAGLKPTVPTVEYGALLASLIEGIATLAGGGLDRKALEGAWAAGWLGILALTR